MSHLLNKAPVISHHAGGCTQSLPTCTNTFSNGRYNSVIKSYKIDFFKSTLQTQDEVCMCILIPSAET